MKRKGYIWTLVLSLYVSLSLAQPDVPLDTLCIFDPPSHLAVPHQAGFSYEWNVNGGQIISQADSSTILVDWGMTPGLYAISVVALPDSGGCPSDTTTATILIIAPQNASGKGQTEVCRGEYITLESSIPSDFVWEGGSTDRFLRFVPQRDTSVFLVALNEECDNDTTRFFITVSEPPMAAMNNLPDTVQLNTTLRLYFTGNTSTVSSVEWLLNDFLRGAGMSLELTLTELGRQEIIQLATNGGCSDTIRKMVYVDDMYTGHFPNAFTPNGDGINDLWSFKGIGHQSFVAEIYNRWGERVYTWTESSPVDGWDGTNNGIASKMDTYIYKVVITDLMGREHFYTDKFHLVR